MVFRNGSSIPLNQQTGTVPDVGGAMTDYFQPMKFSVIRKQTVNFQLVETPCTLDFHGVWQPLSNQSLAMKPEGQRMWKWIMLHADPALILSPDEVVTYLGEKFRVMAKKDYKIYGYVYYELASDYKGGGV